MSDSLITSMVVGVGTVTMVLLTYLLVMVYRVEDGARLPGKGLKQQLRASKIIIACFNAVPQDPAFCFVDQPGGQPIWRPPSTCRCRWNTVWPASLLQFITVRLPPSAMPSCCATFFAVRY